MTPPTTRLPSLVQAACFPARSRSTPSSICSAAARPPSVRFPPIVGMPSGSSIHRCRRPGTPRRTSAGSSATSTMTGAVTRCRPSRLPLPIRSSSCCSRQPTRPSPMRAVSRMASTAPGPASWWARSLAVTSPTSCSRDSGSRRRGCTCGRRWLGAAYPRPTVTGSSISTRRSFWKGCLR